MQFSFLANAVRQLNKGLVIVSCTVNIKAFLPSISVMPSVNLFCSLSRKIVQGKTQHAMTTHKFKGTMNHIQ